MGAEQAKCGKCCAAEGNNAEIVEVQNAPSASGPMEEVKVAGLTEKIAAPAAAHVAPVSAPKKEALAAVEAGGALPSGGEIVPYPDGSTYKGQVQEGKRHGVGTWTSPNGQYEGAWENDYQWGEGKQLWSDGRVYIGQFQKGKFHGQGRMEWHTQQGVMAYEGQYLNDSKDGVGRFEWPDGRVYDGEWQQGKRWGKGTYVNAKKEPRGGVWNDDKLERWVTPSSKDGKAAKEDAKAAS